MCVIMISSGLVISIPTDVQELARDVSLHSFLALLFKHLPPHSTILGHGLIKCASDAIQKLTYHKPLYKLESDNQNMMLCW